LDDNSINELVRLLPSDLIEFMKIYGECVFLDGLIQICNPLTYSGLSQQIFGRDRDFGTAPLQMFAFTAFGILSFWNAKVGYVSVQLLSGEVLAPDLTEQSLDRSSLDRGIMVPFALSKDLLDDIDDAGKDMFARAKKRLGPLEVGECYGFFPLLGLGGPRKVEQLRRVRALEHFSMVAQTTDLRLIDSQSYGQVNTIRLIDR
jgi:hypothetical protein